MIASKEGLEYLHDVCSQSGGDDGVYWMAMRLLDQIVDEIYKNAKAADHNLDVSEPALIRIDVVCLMAGLVVGQMIYDPENDTWEHKRKLLTELIFPMVEAACQGSFEAAQRLNKEGKIRDVIHHHREQGFDQ